MIYKNLSLTLKLVNKYIYINYIIRYKISKHFLTDNHNLIYLTKYMSLPKALPINLAFCIILQNRLPLKFIPQSFPTYFINSKRRFFLYFKRKKDIERTIEIFDRQKVRYFRRESLFPDRQQYEQILFHCNFKYKKRDLRRSLNPETRYKQPKNIFHQKYDIPIDKQLPFILKVAELVEKKDQKIQQQKVTQNKENQIIEQQKQPQYLAEYGNIKVRSQRVFDILNNPSIIKQLLKREKSKR